MPGSEMTDAEIEARAALNAINGEYVNIDLSLARLKGWNKQDGIRGRSLALAITNIEGGVLWLNDAIETIARNNGIDFGGG